MRMANVIRRSVVQRPFDAGSSVPVAVLVEEYDNGAVVETRAPGGRIVLSVDAPVIVANGNDAATVIATFEKWSLDDQGGSVPVGSWHLASPVGEVRFTINTREVVVGIVDGQAVLEFTTDIPTNYEIAASLDGFVPATTSVRAVL